MAKAEQVAGMEDTPDIFKVKREDANVYNHVRGSQTRGSMRSDPKH